MRGIARLRGRLDQPAQVVLHRPIARFTRRRSRSTSAVATSDGTPFERRTSRTRPSASLKFPYASAASAATTSPSYVLPGGAIAGIDANRLLLAELLARHLPGARYLPPESTYLAWIDCRALELGDDPAKIFLELGRVGLSGGLPFGEGGEGHVRFNLATSPAIVTEAVERMAAAVTAYEKGAEA